MTETRLNMRASVREVRAEGEDQSHVAGLGVVYGEWQEIMPGFHERIKKGAVQMNNTVKSFFNHDPNMVLATEKSDPPLVLKDTDKGLEFTTPIPDTSYGRDLRENLKRGNVAGSSFAFQVLPQGDRITEDENGVLYRDIIKLELFEIGPVTDPAYVNSTAQLRGEETVLELRNRAKQEKRLSDNAQAAQDAVNALTEAGMSLEEVTEALGEPHTLDDVNQLMQGDVEVSDELLAAIQEIDPERGSPVADMAERRVKLARVKMGI